MLQVNSISLPSVSVSIDTKSILVSIVATAFMKILILRTTDNPKVSHFARRRSFCLN